LLKYFNMNKVLLVNTNLMKPAIAPIGLDYLASALRNKGYQADLLDLCFAEDFRKAIDEYFKNNSPVVVGITVRNTDDCYFQSGDFFLPKIKEIIHYLKPKTNSPLIMGGVGFSIMPEEILNYCNFDLGISGDGELTFTRLVEKISSGEDYHSLAGLIWCKKGILYSNPREYFDLDKVLEPERNFINNQRYFKEGGQGNIETKRGCNQKCIYCADPIAKGRKIRLRSAKKVVQEIKNLLKQGIDCLHTCDSEFNLPEEHAKAVCEEIIRQKVNAKVKWYTYCSPYPFTEDLAKLMKKAGCVGIDFGVDSGSPKILKILKRNFGVEKIKNTAKLCHKFGITFMYDLLLGGPGETRETVKETISLMKKVSPDRIGVMLGVRVYPGTELARVVRDEGRGLQGDRNDNFLSPIFYLSPQLRSPHRRPAEEAGEDIDKYISDLIAGDERFFFASKEGAVDPALARKPRSCVQGRGKGGVDYNYNQNQILMQAIKQGYKGAYWDILRRWQRKAPTT